MRREYLPLVSDMIRTLKFIAAMFIALSIVAEVGWIKLCHPSLEHFHNLMLKGVKLILYVFFP
jgi:hypothetical protein